MSSVWLCGSAAALRLRTGSVAQLRAVWLCVAQLRPCGSGQAVPEGVRVCYPMQACICHEGTMCGGVTSMCATYVCVTCHRC